MVLVPIHRVTRRLIGVLAVVLALTGMLLLLDQMRHIYHQHLKLRRLDSYSRYVDDVSNQIDKLGILSNRSDLSVDQFLIMLGQPEPQTKELAMNIPHSSNNSNDSNVQFTR